MVAVEETKTNIDQIMVVNTDSNFTLHNGRGRETIQLKTAVIESPDQSELKFMNGPILKQRMSRNMYNVPLLSKKNISIAEQIKIMDTNAKNQFPPSPSNVVGTNRRKSPTPGKLKH